MMITCARIDRNRSKMKTRLGLLNVRVFIGLQSDGSRYELVYAEKLLVDMRNCRCHIEGG